MDRSNIKIPEFKNRIVGAQKERIYLISKEERIAELKRAHYNLFSISSSEKILIDLQTASGTGGLSQKQHAMSALSADPSYTGSASWNRLRDAIYEFTGKEIILPVHQGRAAECILAEWLVEKDDVILSNGFFDTTRANFEYAGARCIDCPTGISGRPFRGNMDIDAIHELYKKHTDRIKAIVMTLTNNTEGGQPVSLENLTAVSEFAREHGVFLILDACRIAQNAYEIWLPADRYPACCSIPEDIPDVIRECFSKADIAYMSLKKDGLSHGGGFIAIDAKDLTHIFRKHATEKLEYLEMLVTIKEGHPKGYGGMSAETMEQAAQGLKEVVDGEFLYERTRQAAYLQMRLKGTIGIPIIYDNPPGGDAVYVDAGALFPHIPSHELPAKTGEVALYELGGIRSCGIDSTMFGGESRKEALRLAIPARRYDEEHFDYVAAVFKEILEIRDRLRGYTMINKPRHLPHFSGHFAPL